MTEEETHVPRKVDLPLSAEPDRPSIAEGLVGGPGMDRILENFFASKSANTTRAYRKDLGYLQAFLGFETKEDLVEWFVREGRAATFTALLEFKAAQVERCAPATVNRRLTAAHSLLQLLYDLGMIDWSVRVKGLRVVPLRDVRGPGHQGYLSMLEVAKHRTDTLGQRNVAILRCLYDLALRRAELVNLDLAHLELDAQRVWIFGKGKTQREAVTLPDPTAASLRDWISVRGGEPGPLFRSFDPAEKGSGRLDGCSVWRIVRGLAQKAGLERPVSTHGLRHAAITRALDLSNGNVRAVRSFSRHSSVAMVAIYDDRRQDLGGEIARAVADYSPAGRGPVMDPNPPTPGSGFRELSS